MALTEKDEHNRLINSSLNYQLSTLESSLKQTIEKNNVLKIKIKRTRNFLQALSKIISEAVSYEEPDIENDGLQGRQKGGESDFKRGFENDTDSENDKLPTLEYLCNQVKRLVSEYLENKQKLYDKITGSFLREQNYFDEGSESNEFNLEMKPPEKRATS